MEIYECLNPQGNEVDIQRYPLCERRDIDNKKIYMIDIGRPNSDVLVKIAAKHLQSQVPTSELVYYCKTKGYRYEEPEEWWEDIRKNASAAILFVGDCGSGTMRTITMQSYLEKMGIPTVSLVCSTFKKDALAVARTIGMPTIRWVEIPYPITDISDEELECNIIPSLGALITALKTPLSEEDICVDIIKAEENPRIIYKGTMEEIQDFFASQHMSDGLPVIPPTEEAVMRMLKGTSHAPNEVLGKMPPEFLEVTVEKVAINGVMCGCQPEHLPVLLATVEALIDPEFDLNVGSRSTTAFAYWSFANGPFAKEIGMNSKTNALGPGNRANAVIGRAIRMFIINLGGSRINVNEMSTIGNPLKYGYSFAENEEDSPWTPYHVDKGFKPDESTITVCESWGFRTQGLASRGKVMGLQNILWSAQNVDSAFGLGKERGIFIVIDPLLAKQLDAKGINKQDIKEYMWMNLRRTVAEWKESLSYTVDLRGNLYPKWYEQLPDDVLIQKFEGPQSIQVVVTGGENSPFYQIYDAVNPHHCVTKSIDKWR